MDYYQRAAGTLFSGKEQVMKHAIIIFFAVVVGAVCWAGDMITVMDESALAQPPVLSSPHRNDCQCGDADCSGGLNSGDGISLLHYLFGGDPVPLSGLEMANWDDNQGLTIRDIEYCFCYAFMDCVPICPPGNPPFSVAVDSGCRLFYTDRVPAGVTQASLALTLHTPDPPDNIFGYAFPVRIRIDGQVPVIDSVLFNITLEEGFPIGLADYSIHPDSGYMAMGAIYIFGIRSAEGIATIYITIPSAPYERQVSAIWVKLSPLQAPTPDSSIFPVLDRIYNGVEPVLTPHCCITAGDANDDGTANIGDAVFLINYVFADGSPPPCASQGDANGDGTANVGDAVQLISYIFKSGPAPVCGP